MERYFESNRYEGYSLSELHDRLYDIERVLVGNILITSIGDSLKRSVVESKGEKFRRNLACSALEMIALCEAVLVKLPDGDVESAREHIEKVVSNELKEEIDELLRKALGVGGE